jgi:hypothetical protein
MSESEEEGKPGDGCPAGTKRRGKECVPMRKTKLPKAFQDYVGVPKKKQKG